MFFPLINLRKEMASLKQNGHFKNVHFSFPQHSFENRPFKIWVITIML